MNAGRVGALTPPALGDQQERRHGYPKGSRVGDTVLTELISPQRFRGRSGLQWRDYADALNILDSVWRGRRVRNTSFGVIGPQPSWEDTIARGGVLFELAQLAQI
jgi:hypothetical protein